MQDDKKIFYLISLLSTYLLLKDKYEDLSTIKDSEESENVKILNSRLSELSKYAFLPDKTKIISESYRDILSRIHGSSVDEEALFDFVTSSVSERSYEEKAYVLNSVIYLAHHDDEISSSEKEGIIQAAYFLGLKPDFKVIMRSYSSSEFVPKASKKIKFAIFITVILLISLISYFLIQKITDSIRVFDQKLVVFNEVNFNRMIVYINKFNHENDYFRKQAIFHINGIAEIGFNPDQLKYDAIKREIVFSYEGEQPFDLKINSTALLIDKITPEKITAEKAAKISAVVGLAGAAAGGVIGNKLSKMLGSNLLPGSKFIATIIGTVGGAAIVGGGAAYLTFNTLNDMQITKDMSQRETDEVVSNAVALVKALLIAEQEMQEMYMNNFEIFVKERYASRGLEVTSVGFKRIEK